VADVKISALPDIVTVAGGDKVAVADASDLTASKSATLDEIATFILNGTYTPGTFTIPTGQFRVMANLLSLTSTQQLIVQGTGRLSMVD
jgi:hypothetical protein